MLKHRFSHVETWVFDLDNTLYPPSARLFSQIEALMTRYVMKTLAVDHATADHLRAHYWQKYGTTLAGLMHEHGIDPGPYLVDVHDISLDKIKAAPPLRAAITALPGRKIIYTNGPRHHAERVARARGLSGVFDAIYGVESADLRPKPERAAFQRVFSLDGLDPACAAMFEDDPRNLLVPYEMGMKTVHVGPEAPVPGDHIHHHTADLAGFLSQLTAPPD